MAWTAPKIQAMLLKVSAPKTAGNLRVATMNQPARQVSPRIFGAESKTSYGVK